MNTLPPKTRYFFRHNYFETASSRYTMKKNRIPRPLIRFIIRDYPKTDFLRDSCNRTALCYLQAELNEPTASFLSSGNSFTSYLRKVSTERKKEKKERKKKKRKEENCWINGGNRITQASKLLLNYSRRAENGSFEGS